MFTELIDTSNSFCVNLDLVAYGQGRTYRVFQGSVLLDAFPVMFGKPSMKIRSSGFQYHVYELK